MEPAETEQLQFLEGCLYQKQLHRWKIQNVVLNLADGSFMCFKPSSLQAMMRPDHGDESRGGNSGEDSKCSTVAVKNKGHALKKDSINTSKTPQRKHKTKPNKSKSCEVNEKEFGLGKDDTADKTDDTFTQLQSSIKVEPSPHRGASPTFSIPSHVPWMMIDVVNDDGIFYVEIPAGFGDEITATNVYSAQSFIAGLFKRGKKGHKADLSDRIDYMTKQRSSLNSSSSRLFDDDTRGIDNNNTSEVLSNKSVATKRGSDTKTRRYYFKCPEGGNEKALWIKASQTIGRMSSETKSYRSRKFLHQLGGEAVARIRSPEKVERAQIQYKTERKLSVMSAPMSQADLSQVGCNSGDQKEFKVLPMHRYPHRWMTHDELKEEMLRDSTNFHDLRSPLGSNGTEEIGSLRVEVLSCAGLPKMDRFGKSDTVCYLVCGSCAFSTDVIPMRYHPMWLRHTKRACVFPLHHAFAQLFVGTFDDDGDESDEFIGRVVIDVSRLRADLVYDVTLPLRESQFVYMRRSRGTIRLRFRLTWKSERCAILSYVPTKKQVQDRLKGAPAATVKCADKRVFRNIVTTVHGAHLPGRYSTKAYRAVMREMKLYKIMLKYTLTTALNDLRSWKNPVMSLVVFSSWMHCVYANSLSLVPPYFMLWMLMFLIRSYGHVASSKSNWGFAPVTLEELFMSLLLGDPRLFRRFLRGPISADSAESRRYLRGLIATDSAGSNAMRETPQNYITPTIRSLWRRGFGRQEKTPESSRRMRKDLHQEDHMEFPFSDAETYPKISLDAARATRPKGLEEELFYNHSRDSLLDDDDEADDVDDDYINSVATMPNPDGLGQNLLETGRGNTIESNPVSETTEATHYALGAVAGTGGTSDPSLTAQVTNTTINKSELLPVERQGKKNLAKPPPNQDASVFIKAKTSFKQDVEIAMEKMQRATFRILDDHIFIATAAGNAEPCESNDEVRKELEKELGINSYSNPIKAQKAMFLSPMMDSIKLGLAFTRAATNLFLWKDPYLTFWACIWCFMSSIILFAFPWRCFFFVVGVVAFGPQNFLIRLRSHRTTKHGKEVDNNDNFSYKKQSNTKIIESSTIDHGQMTHTEPVLPSQAVIRCHSRDLTPNYVLKENEIATHEVVVPYSAFRQYRFYDWPPDPNVSSATSVSFVDNESKNKPCNNDALKDKLLLLETTCQDTSQTSRRRS